MRCGYSPPPVLYIATVHYRSPRWIEIQTSHLRKHISVPFQTWTSLERIDAGYGSHFDRVLKQRGSHAGKLNHLAMEISHLAEDDDLLMFLDGDAFPIADPMPLIADSLTRAPLLAVRRAENADEPQPHPCFCVTTVGSWRSLPGDWTAGPAWIGAHGALTSDVGGNLMRRLELSEQPWIELLRSNRHALDGLHFAIYGDVVYHHGAGFRTGELSPAHREHAPQPLPLLQAPPLRPLGRLINSRRWRRWERSERARHVRQSELVYERIARGGEAWLEELREPAARADGDAAVPPAR
jgi:hypothetical protein